MANRLQHETSLYLLQHAHNPVDWFPWGEEALIKAKKEDKPILLSIGYAACHWCHVMEKENFELPSVAHWMNQYFVNIKVDREERPDIDHIYMDAVQAITGSGGWPLHVFLTPSLEPFFGGTYFPPTPMQGRASWIQVLQYIATRYKEKKEDILKDIALIKSFLAKPSILTQENVSPPLADIPHRIFYQLAQHFDKKNGGFGNAPKFLQTSNLLFLLHYDSLFQSSEAKHIVNHSLLQMLQGGIFDTLAGGICRYSTDAAWRYPHFEKMLYDNALFLQTLASAYHLYKTPAYYNAIQQIQHFLRFYLQSPQHGYYSTLDADSNGEEGSYYIWTKKEIENILQDTAESDLFCKYYHITEEGNWEENKNILYTATNITTLADDYNLPDEKAIEIIEKCKKLLLKTRQQRISPARDEKIILGWNALLISAYCQCYISTKETIYINEALQLISFLEQHLSIQNQWYHVINKNKLGTFAFLDDYAFLIQAYILLFQIRGEEKFIQSATRITEKVMQEFLDESTSFFYYTSIHHTDILLRKIEYYDGAIPSGNATMANNLYTLGCLLDKSNWKTQAEKMVYKVVVLMQQYPLSFGEWSLLLQKISKGYYTITVEGISSNNYLIDIHHACFLPNKIISYKINHSIPLQISICTPTTCLLPTHSVALFSQQLHNIVNCEVK